MQEVMHRLHDELEDSHWWFAARRRIVLDVLRRALARREQATPPRLLDIGCGAGGTLRELATLGEAFGVDPEPGAVEATRRRCGCPVRQGGLPHDIPFEPGTFDVVTLLDVLEHVRDDAASLATIERLLVPGGVLLCTVPAYPFLWSRHDVLNQHERRYLRRQLAARLRDAGLEPRKLTYFSTLLFPPIAGVRLLQAGSQPGAAASTGDLGRVPEPLNALLAAIFAAERYWLRYAAFPFGVSILALARKPGGQR